ncbi:ABC transporter permease [Halobacillus halophilus]|uniref:ABC-type transport system permease protein (Probable substrate peptide/nickel) n=1 Tax=Halobacillus halophilus (strain ATCC 35676 / DSM 2266 / JCM 20832 / KCTC 3685 / LMG 17431 / NBRC 102448 / NCIMB 2269) TaxID=866895 RepID=I0JKI4_HALH3|nr:oligopeptide ABC transporter permease [Halobacillus halophilus]ASF38796.1 ABC transporter permease [Halobacillus halophilus]CCG44653.1 ABC-type transport system permease protein (probable substrate peptide/nickel) [Halobacillus halophilus DSM 2266]
MDNHKPSKELFVPVERQENEGEKIARPSLSFWQDSFMRLRKNVGAMIGLATLIILMLMAIFGPYMNQYGEFEQDLGRAKMPPKVEGLGWLGMDGTLSATMSGSTVEQATTNANMRFNNDEEFIKTSVVSDGSNGEPAQVKAVYDVYAAKDMNDQSFWFGTDGLGRDLWTRTWKGTRISLYIALLAAAIDMVIGVAYGGISAYYGGRVDNYMQRIIEILMGIPNLVVVILMILILEPGILSITIALTITGWISMARIVRGQILKLKNQEFVLASRTLGAPDNRILRKHLVPNVTGLIVINTMFTIPSAIFFEAFLSFIGLGLPTPIASLGTLIDDGFKSLQIYPHILLFPAIVISLIMIAFNVLADGLRDAFDPKMRE